MTLKDEGQNRTNTHDDEEWWFLFIIIRHWKVDSRTVGQLFDSIATCKKEKSKKYTSSNGVGSKKIAIMR